MPYVSLEISVPEPCSEDWNKMAPAGDNRRHCDSCEKSVVDFTYMTDREVLNHYQNNDGKICGRFRASQLNRKLTIGHRSSRRGAIAAAAAASLLLAAPLAGQQVLENPTEPAAIHLAPTTSSAPAAAPKTLPRTVRLNGVVTDVDGETLIGASVLVKGTTTGAVTDIDGKFSLVIDLTNEPVLVVFYTGFATREEPVSKVDLTQLESGDWSIGPIAVEESASGGMRIVVTYYSGLRPGLLDNLMVHKITTIRPGLDVEGLRKDGDWKDYWRDLFAKRKARRAERKIEKQRLKTEKLGAKIVAPAEEVLTTKVNEAPQAISFGLKASPNPFTNQLRNADLITVRFVA
jgi:hypothetical protein